LIPLFAIILGIALVPAVGGTLGVLRRANLQAAVLVPFALLLQTFSASGGFPWGAAHSALLSVALWMAGAALLAAVCLSNHRLHGMRIIALGLCMNALVIAANVGMPVGLTALAELDATDDAREAVEQSALYQMQEETTYLIVLADVLPVPGPTLMRAVVSLGDLLLFVGVVVTIVESSTRYHAPRRRLMGHEGTAATRET
jgi:hypothetical protein